MFRNSAGAPVWLFSFLDLAFLMLIALLHVAESPGTGFDLELGQIAVPRIDRSSTEPLPADAAQRWQIRIHPLRDSDSLAIAAPFSLVPIRHEPTGLARPRDARPQDAAELEEAGRLKRERLAALLAELRRQETAKPLLAPHRDARSEDFLTALALVQQHWSESSYATVKPQEMLPSVSADAQERW